MPGRLFQRVLLFLTGFTVWRHLSQVLFRPGPRGDLDILLLAAERFLRFEPVYRLSDGSEHTKPPLLMPLLLPLASLPRNWVHAFWDLLLLALPFALFWLWNRYREPAQAERLSPTTGMLGLFLLSPLWLVEAQYGQYNLLQLVLITACLLLFRSETSRLKSVAAGVIFTATTLLKPTVIFFAPWFWVVRWKSVPPQNPASSRYLRSLLRGSFDFGAGALALLALLFTIYASFRSLPLLCADLQEWKAFIAQSQARHLLRDDNFGIPTFLARHGWDPKEGLTLLLAPLALTLIVCALALRANAQRGLLLGFLWIHAATLTFSPMAWRQNFVVFLPLAWELLVTFKTRSNARWLTGIGIFALFLVGRVSDYWVSRELQAYWSGWAGPSFLTWLAVATFSVAVLTTRPQPEA